ncbi:aspartate kinase [Oligoflexus tunisiensis]|uniref:aspartate kinase n=1 Tax=Oligoflexus tunisiensis TaxID=708132 RepID=UPI000A506AAC|nr:aspartate kinase [Oligoflexus tunisiensis]
MSLYIQKYGGTSVGTLERIRAVAEHIAATYRQGHRLVVVVSAMGQQTDELLDMALALSPEPPQREVDMLLSVGERISMSLLAIALNEMKVPTVSFTGSQSGILTDDTHGNARIQKILGDRIRKALDSGKLVIVAGFQGMSEAGKEITTLGRGGSDLTAIALAHTLKADRCQIYKDVDGVCSADPRLVPSAQVMPSMSWDSLSHLTWYGSGVVHNRGVHLAKKYQIPLEIRSSFNLETPGTLVGGSKTVERAVVHAITHRKDLSWIRISDCQAGTISPVLSYLFTLGEHPLFVQQQHTEHGLTMDLVLSQKFKDKLAAFITKVCPGAKANERGHGLACITLVGDGFWQQPELLGRMLESLGQSPLLFDCKNAVANLLIPQEHLEQGLRSLHRDLIEAAVQ